MRISMEVTIGIQVVVGANSNHGYATFRAVSVYSRSAYERVFLKGPGHLIPGFSIGQKV